MRQRGRRSAQALAINATGKPLHLTAPEGLNAKERAEFEALINACDSSQFRTSDIPLLVALAQASLLSRQLGRDSTKIADWEKACRVQAMLATKLRLTPQARTDPKTIARSQDGVAEWHKHRPWLPAEEEQEE